MAHAELFVWRPVTLTTPLEAIISHAGYRATCDRCGEEILNQREVVGEGLTLCHACAHGGYYRTCDALSPAEKEAHNWLRSRATSASTSALSVP